MMTPRRPVWLLALMLALLAWAPAGATVPIANPTKGVGFDQRLDAPLPLSARFLDENGDSVRLRRFFHGKPVILVMTYFQCPMLCTEVLNELTRSPQEVSLDAGRDFQVVAISIDARDTPAVARVKRDRYAFRYSRPGSENGWHFLTGGKPRRVADAIGFRYRWDRRLQEFVHASGIVVATPDGHASQYFLGLKYDPERVRKALVQAGAGTIGTPVEGSWCCATSTIPAPASTGWSFSTSCASEAWPPSWRSASSWAAPPGGSAGALGSLVYNFHFFPHEASNVSIELDRLVLVLLTVSAIVCVGVFILITYFCIKYRRGSRANRSESPSGNMRAEIAWSATPFAIFMVFFFWGAALYYRIEVPPRHTLDVYVVAKQWMWKVEHVEGRREINELHLPMGVAVRLIMTSQDVIHSFFVPDFRIHQDVLPDRYTMAWFVARRVGRYHLFCSQFCGSKHSEMIGEVYVMEPAEYQRWLARPRPIIAPPVGRLRVRVQPTQLPGAGSGLTLAEQGERIYESMGCAACHGNAKIAPSFHGLFMAAVPIVGGRTMTADENYLRDCILTPQLNRVDGYAPIMPSFAGRLNDSDVFALIAFIKSFAGPSPKTGAARKKGGKP